MKEVSKSGLVIAFAIGVLLAFLSTWVWTPPWIRFPPPLPGIGPPITHTTYDRSLSKVTMTDSSSTDHPYTYSSDADTTAVYLVASQPSAQWSNDTVTFSLVTMTAVSAKLTATNLQLVSLKKVNQTYEVIFEPFGSSSIGDEVKYVFDNTKYVDAKTLAMALKHAEGAPTRLSVVQDTGTPAKPLNVTLALQ